jgi:hypothetical protein
MKTQLIGSNEYAENGYINAELEKLDLSVNGLNLSTTVILISCKC